MGHMDRYYVCGSLMFIAHINVIICHLIALVTELQNSEDTCCFQTGRLDSSWWLLSSQPKVWASKTLVERTRTARHGVAVQEVMYCADLMASPGETHTHQRRHGIAIAFDFVGWMQEYLFKEGRILSARRQEPSLQKSMAVHLLA